jgi:hypothetical protein
VKGRLWSHVQLNSLEDGAIITPYGGEARAFHAQSMDGKRLFLDLHNNTIVSAKTLIDMNPDGFLHQENMALLEDDGQPVLALSEAPTQEDLVVLAAIMGVSVEQFTLQEVDTSIVLGAHLVETDMQDSDVFYAFWFLPNGCSSGVPPVKLVGPKSVRDFCIEHQETTESMELRITDEYKDFTVACMVGRKFIWPTHWADME